MNKILRPKFINLNPEQRIQDCDRYHHRLADYLPARPTGTFFYSRIYDIWTETDEVKVGMKSVELLKDAHDSWETLCECYGAAIIASALVCREGNSPGWLVQLMTICMDSLEEDWQSKKPYWDLFINGFAERK